ncbi:MAG: hypothetical protein U0V70_08225 [Terriglobia bacterium]
MTIFGKSLSEYVQFQKAILGFIVIVGLGRLGLSLAGVPNSTVKFLSLTAATILAWLFVTYKVHKAQFGGYKQLLPLIVIQNLVGQIVVAAAVALAILTTRVNIYTAPEYSGGADGRTWGHAGAHLFFVTIFGSIVGWGISSLLLFILRKTSAKSQATTSQAEARSKSAGAGR